VLLGSASYGHSKNINVTRGKVEDGFHLNAACLTNQVSLLNAAMTG